MSDLIPDAIDRFAAAVADLLANSDLAYAVPGEMAVVAELFVRMRQNFPGWTVSNEYDRREQERKRLAYDDANGVLRDAPIRPDLIVHKVGLKENLLVVEVKLHTNQNHARDIWKLRGMTDHEGPYAYAIGVHLVIDIGARRVAGCQCFVDGEDARKWADHLLAQL